MCHRCFPQQKCQSFKNRIILTINLFLLLIYTLILCFQKFQQQEPIQKMVYIIVIISCTLDFSFDLVFNRLRYNYTFHNSNKLKAIVSVVILLKLISCSASMTNFILFLMTYQSFTRYKAFLIFTHSFHISMFIFNALPKTAYLNFRLENKLEHAQDTYTGFFCQFKSQDLFTKFIIQNNKIQMGLVSSQGTICEQECIICMENFISKQKTIRTECGHQFHLKCMTSWLKNKLSCPICRNVL